MTFARNLRFVHLAAILAMFAGTLAAPSAFGQDARALYQRGQEAYNQGRYEDAIRDFQAAYDIDARPALLYNLAQAYERWGKLSEAADALTRYLAEATDAPNRAEAQLKLRNIQDRLERTGVRIIYDEPGGSITIDDQRWGLTPRPDPIRVPPGTHTVRVTRDGYSPFSARVIVPAGQVLDVEVTLERAGGGGGGGGTTGGGGGRAGGGGGGGGSGGGGGGGGGEAQPGPGGEEDGDGGGEEDGEEGADDATEGGGTNLLPYLLLGGGGALVVGGGVVGVLALGAANDAPASEGTEADRARFLALMADIGVGVGIAAAAVGAYFLFFTDEEPESAAGSVQVGPVTAPGYAGAAATVRFE